MQNKICVITGANSGVGKMAAMGLASKGAHIVMFCRNMEKAAAAQKEIVQHTDNRNIEIIQCDLSSFDSIRQAANVFLERHPKLNVLLNNAGLYTNKYHQSTDGIEMTMAVNHYGHFLLTNLLLPALKKAENARVINISSEANRFAEFSHDKLLPTKAHFKAMKIYGLSKLANIMFTHELAKRWAASGIVSNSCHPGFVDSNFFENFNGLLRWMVILAKPFMINEEQGAETPIYLCSAKNAANINGKYFVRKSVKKPHPLAFSDEHSVLLWDKSEEVTGVHAEI